MSKEDDRSLRVRLELLLFRRLVSRPRQLEALDDEIRPTRLDAGLAQRPLALGALDGQRQSRDHLRHAKVVGVRVPDRERRRPIGRRARKGFGLNPPIDLLDGRRGLVEASQEATAVRQLDSEATAASVGRWKERGEGPASPLGRLRRLERRSLGRGELGAAGGDALGVATAGRGVGGVLLGSEPAFGVAVGALVA